MSLFLLIFQKCLKVSYKVLTTSLLLVRNRLGVSNAGILYLYKQYTTSHYRSSLLTLLLKIEPLASLNLNRLKKQFHTLGTKIYISI